MAKKQTQKRSATADGNVDGNVDKIREILFGGQMRDYEQRFADLEQRLGDQMDRMSGDFEKRMERLDAFAKREFDKIASRMKEERSARLESSKQQARELKELTQRTESLYADLQNFIEGESAELREAVTQQKTELSGMLEESHEEQELAQSLQARTQSVADSSVSKSDLAELFLQLGSRLKKDAK